MNYILYTAHRSRSYHLMQLMEQRGIDNLGEYFDAMKGLDPKTLNVLYRVPGAHWEGRLLHSQAKMHMEKRFNYWYRRVTTFNPNGQSTVAKLHPSFLQDPSLISKLHDAGVKFIVLTRENKWEQCVSYCLAEQTNMFRVFVERPYTEVTITREVFWQWVQRCIVMYYGWREFASKNAIQLEYEEVYESNAQLDELFGPRVKEVAITPPQNSMEKVNRIKNLDELRGWFDKASWYFPI